jgi:hypothetical protein
VVFNLRMDYNERMKKILILLFSLLISFNSYGEENWIPVTDSSDAVFYVNFDSIKEDSGYVYWWQMRDYSNQDDNGYMSDQSYIQGDCGVNRIKLLSYNFYKQPMGNVLDKTVTAGNMKWVYPPPDTVASTILSRICSIVSS